MAAFPVWLFSAAAAAGICIDVGAKAGPAGLAFCVASQGLFGGPLNGRLTGMEGAAASDTFAAGGLADGTMKGGVAIREDVTDDTGTGAAFPTDGALLEVLGGTANAGWTTNAGLATGVCFAKGAGFATGFGFVSGAATATVVCAVDLWLAGGALVVWACKGGGRAAVVVAVLLFFGAGVISAFLGAGAISADFIVLARLCDFLQSGTAASAEGSSSIVTISIPETFSALSLGSVDLGGGASWAGRFCPSALDENAPSKPEPGCPAGNLPAAAGTFAGGGRTGGLHLSDQDFDRFAFSFGDVPVAASSFTTAGESFVLGALPYVSRRNAAIHEAGDFPISASFGLTYAFGSGNLWIPVRWTDVIPGGLNFSFCFGGLLAVTLWPDSCAFGVSFANDFAFAFGVCDA